MEEWVEIELIYIKREEEKRGVSSEVGSCVRSVAINKNLDRERIV